MADFDLDKTPKRDDKKKKKDKDKKDHGYQQFEDDSASIDAVVLQPRPSHGDAQASGAASAAASSTASAAAASGTLSPKAKKTKSFKLPTKRSILKKSSTDKEDKKKQKKQRRKNLKDEVEQQTPNRPVFGVPLALAAQRSKSHDGVALPACFRECLDFVEANALKCEGIYRVSGVKSKVQSVIRAYNLHLSVELSDYDPFVVASVIKNFIRELPECVLTEKLLPEFERSWNIRESRQKVEAFRRLLSALPAPNYMLLAYTLLHMSHVVSHQAENKMSLQNVSIVLSPTMQISHKVLHVFFSHLDDLFAGVAITRYQPPLKPHARMEIPETLEDVEAELAKQESLLEWLHQELSALKADGLDSQDKSNLVWEVQRVVTALKRKKSLIELEDIEAIESELSKQETALNRLHAALTGCPTDDQETQDQLWEVQRTITMLKRKLRKTGAGPRPSLPGAAAPAGVRGSASSEYVAGGGGVGMAKSPSFPAPPGGGIRPDMSALEENLELNLALRRVDVQVHHHLPSAAKESSEPLPPQQMEPPQMPQQPQPQQQPHQHQQELQQQPAAEDLLPPPPAGPEAGGVLGLSRLDSLRDSSRWGDSSIADTDTDVELSALTRNPPPLELQEDEPDDDDSGTEERDDDDQEMDDHVMEEEEADDDEAQPPQDLDQLAYRLEEEENQLLCASEVEEETADLLAVVEDLRRLRLEEEELAQLSAELGLRVTRERQEMERLRAEVDRWAARRDQRAASAAAPDDFPDTSSSASSDSDEESDSALLDQWHFFREDNQRLVKENADLAERLQKERMLCAEYRVQLRVQAAYGPLISIGP